MSEFDPDYSFVASIAIIGVLIYSILCTFIIDIRAFQSQSKLWMFCCNKGHFDDCVCILLMCYYLQFNTQLYVITDKGVDDVWIKEAEYSGISSAVLNIHPCNSIFTGIHVVRTDCPSGHTM